MKENCVVQSTYLNESVQVGVVLPSRSCQRITILLHGYSGSFQELDNNLPLQEYADTYEQVIVCPNLGNDYYIDREGKEYGAFLALELPAYIKMRYHEERPIDMVLAGISMGGYGAMLTACHYPESFAHVVCVGSAFIAHDVSIGNPEICGSASNASAVHYFLAVFGPDVSDLDESSERNPLAAIRYVKDEEKQPFYWLICGKRDLMYTRNLKAVKELFAHSRKFEWHELAGGHTYACFDEGLRFAMRHIAVRNILE